MICPKCHNCGRQFVEKPENTISQDKKDLIDKLLLERIPLAGIARVVGVSERWLPGYVNRKYQEVPRHIDVKKTERKTDSPM